MRIDLSDEEFKDMIGQYITGPHKDLLSLAIFGLIESEWQRKLLLKAALGLQPKCELKLNEEYLVKKSSVSTYDMAEALTREAGLLSSDNMFTCTLIEFRPWDPNKYRISYKYLKADGSEYPRKYEVNANELRLAEEFPEDFFEDL